MNFVDTIFLAAKEFEKQAGLFEEPLDLYTVMQNWALRRYFEQVLGRLITKPETVESTNLIQGIRKRGFGPAKPIKSISTKFPLSKIINWKYIAESDRDKLIQLLKQKGWNDSIPFVLILDPRNNETYHGNFATDTKKIKITTDAEVSNAKAFNEETDEIRDAISHELTHLGQLILTDYKSLKNEAGSWSKKEKEPQSKDYLNQDIEFYPILKDWIKIFNRYSFPSRENQEAYFKQFVEGENPENFFAALKEKEPDKWRKAVKECYKHIKWLEPSNKDN